jgi:hypothetical protein
MTFDSLRAGLASNRSRYSTEERRDKKKMMSKNKNINKTKGSNKQPCKCTNYY